MSCSNVELQVHRIRKGNTLTPMGFILTQGGEARDLTGLTVKCIGWESDGTTEWFAENTSRVTVLDDDAGTGQIDFESGDVDTAGTYYVDIRVYSGSEYDTHPKVAKRMAVVIS